MGGRRLVRHPHETEDGECLLHQQRQMPVGHLAKPEALPARQLLAVQQDAVLPVDIPIQLWGVLPWRLGHFEMDLGIGGNCSNGRISGQAK